MSANQDLVLQNTLDHARMHAADLLTELDEAAELAGRSEVGRKINIARTDAEKLKVWLYSVVPFATE